MADETEGGGGAALSWRLNEEYIPSGRGAVHGDKTRREDTLLDHAESETAINKHVDGCFWSHTSIFPHKWNKPHHFSGGVEVLTGNHRRAQNNVLEHTGAIP